MTDSVMRLVSMLKLSDIHDLLITLDLRLLFLVTKFYPHWCTVEQELEIKWEKADFCTSEVQK